MAQLLELLPDSADQDFVEVVGMFNALYEHMDQTGLKMPLVDGGAERFINGIKRNLGKNYFLLVAKENEEFVGFGIGTLRLAPPYLGSVRVGAITHAYVAEGHRGKGIAAQLFQKIESWLTAKDVHSLELEVLVENEGAVSLWKRLGYEPELLKMRK